ncbi:MAG: hypothetical protein KGD63_15705 [Candidatus Lokiarchaeota archaeon]|nr:hypothetical protein [Candidatus Lokiarchaeota archaeon]
MKSNYYTRSRFEVIKVTNRWKAQKKLTKSKEEVLKEYSLMEERLKDPLFIPEMLDIWHSIS